MNISIEQTSTDGLQRMEWRFWVTTDSVMTPPDTVGAIFSYYAHSARPTTRHKFRTFRFWDRLRGKRTHYSSDTQIETPPEVPAWVCEQVKERVTAGIQFKMPEKVTA